METKQTSGRSGNKTDFRARWKTQNRLQGEVETKQTSGRSGNKTDFRARWKQNRLQGEVENTKQTSGRSGKHKTDFRAKWKQNRLQGEVDHKENPATHGPVEGSVLATSRPDVVPLKVPLPPEAFCRRVHGKHCPLVHSHPVATDSEGTVGYVLDFKVMSTA